MEIRPGSPAARAGLTVGDRMTQFDGRSISSQAQLVQLVLAASATVPVLVDRSGSEEPVTVEIELDGKPIRLGLSWREDEGEPGSVTVIHVVAGSPAYHGGLKMRDRVYEVNGKPFQDSDAFRQMVTTLDMPMNLLVERHGLLEQVTLQPLDGVERVARRE
jgi:S1-C subfamily serine protease